VTVRLPTMLWLLPAQWTVTDVVLYPLSIVYHSIAQSITGLLSSMHISNLRIYAHLPILETYLDYLSSRYAIQLLFQTAGHGLYSLPITPHCPNLALGTTHLHSLINPLLLRTLETHSIPHIDFSIRVLFNPFHADDQP
jgi:hypothetical protein